MDSLIKQGQGSWKSYVFAWLSSLFLCLVAYGLVVWGLLVGMWLAAGVIGCALLQALIQLWGAMQLGKEPKPYWNLQSFIYMMIVALVVILGSLWIMANLDYNVMPDM